MTGSPSTRRPPLKLALGLVFSGGLIVFFGGKVISASAEAISAGVEVISAGVETSHSEAAMQPALASAL